MANDALTLEEIAAGAGRPAAAAPQLGPAQAPPAKEPCGPSCGCHGKAEVEPFESRVTKVLEKMRPFLQMDGGDLELIAIEDNNALVRLHGACSSCSISDVHMKMGVEQAIKRELPEFGELIVIE